MAITKVDDHVEQAQGLLIEQYQERPRLAAWLASYSTRCQEAEDMLWDVLTKRLIDNAEGAQLDMIGKIVDEPRQGRDDATYKVYVLAKIRINWSQGTPDDVIAVLQILDAAAFRYVELYPASFEIQYDAPPAAPLGTLADVIHPAKESGMSHAVVGSSDPSTTLQFTYLDGEASTTRGLSGNNETTGGHLAGHYLAGAPNTG